MSGADKLFRLMPGGLHPTAGSVRPSIDRISTPSLDRQIEAVRKGVRVDTVVCCLLDTDPLIPLMTSAATSFGDQLATGLERLAESAGGARVVVAADPSRPLSWVQPLKGRISRVKVAPVWADYPQSDPTLLLYSVLDRQMAPDRLPTDAGVVLVDAVAAIVLGRRILDPAGPDRTPLAVFDHFGGVTHLLDVPTDCTVDRLLDFLDVPAGPLSIRRGDFLRDLFAERATTIGGGEVVLHLTAASSSANPDPCVRCGWCVEACPTNINPAGLLDAAQFNDRTRATRYGLHACIECGVCSYVCPTRLPLLPSIRAIRAVPASSDLRPTLVAGRA